MQGDALDLDGFEVVASTTSTQSIPLELAFSEFGAFKATFRASAAAAWTIAVYYKTELVGAAVESSRGGGVADVQVIGGDVSTADSSFECPAEAAAFGRVYCTMAVKDQYGNPTDGTSALETAFSFYVESEGLNPGTFVEVMPAEMYMNMDDIIVNNARDDHGDHSGLYVAAFNAPLNGIVSISMAHLTDGGGSVPLGGANPQIINIQQTEINVAASTVVCSGSEFVAGDPITCQILIVGHDLVPVGDKGLLAALRCTVVNQGLLLASQVQTLGVGQYQATFTAKASGLARFRVSYLTQDGVSIIGSDASSTSEEDTWNELSITPSKLASQLSNLQCPAGPRTSGEPVVCVLRSYDEHGNAQGTELDLDGFNVVASTASGDRFNLEVEFVKFGQFQASFTATLAAQWEVVAKFNSETVGTGVGAGDGGIAEVYVIGGDISAGESSFECPAGATAFGRVYCVINMRDQYNNPTDGRSMLDTAFSFYVGSEGLELGALIEIMPAEMHMNMDDIIVNNARVGHGEHSGLYVAVFSAPLSGIVSIDMVYLQDDDDAVVLGGTNPQTIQIQQTLIDAAASTVVCPESAAAGETITCQIYVVGPDGDSVGEKGLLGAFATHAINMGYERTAQLQFVQAGQYQASWTATKAGVARISVEYRGDSGFEVLGVPADDVEGGWATVDIAAAPLEPEATSIHCPPTARAGSAVFCVVEMFDQYGNKQGAESVADLLSIAGHNYLDDGLVSELGSLEFESAGVLRASLTLSRSGMWEVTVSSAFTTTATSVTVAPGDIDAGQSYVSCPGESPGFASVRCTLFARDSFGNSALSTADAVNNVFVQLTNVTASTLAKVSVAGDAADGQFHIAFDAPGM
jgi:hypothetical protein